MHIEGKPPNLITVNFSTIQYNKFYTVCSFREYQCNFAETLKIVGYLEDYFGITRWARVTNNFCFTLPAKSDIKHKAVFHHISY